MHLNFHLQRKTFLLTLLWRKSVSNTNQICMSYTAMPRKLQDEILGLLFDEKLFWKSHTNHIQCKNSKLLDLSVECRIDQNLLHLDTLVSFYILAFSVSNIFFLLMGREAGI